MCRALISWVLTVSIAFPVWALTPQQTKTVQDFLTTTGLSTRAVTWSEFYQKIERDLPMDVQREMQLFIKLNPSAKIPQPKVSKLKQGKDEVVQLEFTVGKEKSYLLISGKSEFATIKGKQGGKKFDRRVRLSDLRNPVRFMTELSGQATPWTEVVPSVQILTMDQVKKLGPAQRRAYVDKLRDLLVSAEKVQSAFGNSSKSASLQDYLLQQLVEEAFAAVASGECIVAGWVGQYRNNSCEPPQQARSTGCAKCNSEIYGSSSPCISFANGKLPLNATEICNQRTESNKYAVFQGVKNQSELANKLQSLSGVLTGLREKCTSIEAGVVQGAKLLDQQQTCSHFKGRITELEAVQCQILEQQPNHFPDLRCRPLAVISPPQEPPQPVGPSVNRPASGDCTNLPTSPTQLRCQASPVIEIACEEDGEQVAKYYCACGPGEEVEKQNSNLAVACHPLRKDSTGGIDSYRGERPKKEEPWFKPWMGIALAGAAGLALWYYGTKSTLEKQYSLITPTTVATPVPAPYTPPSPVTAPTPIDISRPPPTGTR
jgi:hypothetical protein